MFKVCVQDIPTNHNHPRIFTVDNLDKYFELNRKFGDSWVLIWIKDNTEAYHYACIRPDNSVMQRHSMDFNTVHSKNKMHLSTAYIEAKDKKPEPVKLAP